MADSANPFIDPNDAQAAAPQAPSNPFIDPADVNAPIVAKPMRTEDVSDSERFIFQNLFDNDKARRASYAKSIGLELDPKDDNMVRALGSQGPFQAKIDPSFGDAYKKGGFVGVAKELGKDVLSDMAMDYATGGVAAMAASGGAAAGGLTGAGTGAAGGAVAGPAGAAAGAAGGGGVGAIIGGILGGFGGAYAGEDMKEFLGDQMLNDKIPVPIRQKVLYSAMNALGPVVMKAAGGLVKGGVKGALELRKQAIGQLLSQGGDVSAEAVTKAITNPELFTQQATDGATSKIRQFYGNFFGADPGDTGSIVRNVRDMSDNAPKGVLGDFLKPIYAQKQAAMQSLAQDRGADVTLGQLKQPLLDQYTALTSKISQTPQDAQAIGVLEKQLGEWDNLADKLTPKDAAPQSFSVEGGVPSAIQGVDGAPIPQAPGAAAKADPSNIRINHGQAREFLAGLQGKAFDMDTASQNPIVNQVAGKLRSSLDEVAANSGNDAGKALPQLNQQISKATQVYQDAASTLTPENMKQAFVLAPNTNRLDTLNTLSQIDSITGQNFSKEFEKGALQSKFESLYKQSAAKGSSRTNAAMVSGAVSGGAKGAGIGAAIGLPLGATGVTAPIGGLIGAGLGAAQASLVGQPEKALGKIAADDARQKLLDYIGQQGSKTLDSGYVNPLVRGALAGSTVPADSGENSDASADNEFLK